MDKELREIFAKIFKRFDSLDARLDKQDARLDKQDAHLAKQDAHLAKQDAHLAKQDDRLDKHDERFDRIDEQLAKMQSDIHRSGILFEEMSHKIDVVYDVILANEETLKVLNRHASSLENHEHRIGALESVVRNP